MLRARERREKREEGKKGTESMVAGSQNVLIALAVAIS